jgi:hypothetical protein
MKTFFALSFLCFNITFIHGQNAHDSISREVNIPVEKTECTEARDHAIADFKKGIRKIYTFGLVDDVKYRRILSEKYNIDARYMGCLVLPDKMCYSHRMEELIAQERGFGFFEKVRLETGTKSVPFKTVIKSVF